MVRLKVYALPTIRAVRIVFQFQNGAVKSLIAVSGGVAIGSFNSKMVRLKVTGIWSDNLSVVGFQFQNGAVKSTKTMLCRYS